jgi:CDP-glycerol glycerophosphotransferase
LIHNTEFRQNLPLRDEQVYINTQHGTPLKLMGSDMVDHNPDIPGQGKRWNYYPKNGRWSHLISPNRHTTDIFRRVFQFDGSVLEIGYPRNDLFYNRNTPEDIRSLKIRMGIPLDRKVILYAPTWRNHGASRQDRKFKLRLDLKALQESFGDTHVIILRLHHLIVSALKKDPTTRDFAFDRSSSRYDAQELLLISDVLITDYSSMLFDYSNLRRPIIFFAYDIDEYSSSTRGMYFDLKQKAPGPVVTDMDGILHALGTIDSWRPEYAEREEAFYNEYCYLDDGRAAQKLIDQVIGPACGV